MPLLLEQLQWEEPLVPETVDPVWEAEVHAIMPTMPGSFRRTASSPWVRRAYLDLVRAPMSNISVAEAELAGMVTSQENACRYCYGSARFRMKMIGFSDEMIDRIERNAQLVEADPRERELVQFCRNLARSKPRPSRQAREVLQSVGFSALATAELAAVVALVGFCNRVSTLLAVPPELEMEAQAKNMKGIWNKLTALHLVFAVIARTLECGLCENTARDLLEAEGCPRATLDEVLSTLGSPALTEMEALLVPWARDTVWMPEQPARIQERTRPLLDALGPEVLVEAVGAAALANGCVRLTMLQV
jgi:uncharacterized peroxidase-related enzyme